MIYYTTPQMKMINWVKTINRIALDFIDHAGVVKPKQIQYVLELNEVALTQSRIRAYLVELGYTKVLPNKDFWTIAPESPVRSI